MKKIIIINGPNLNLLGSREAKIYGKQDFDSFFNTLRSKYINALEIEYYQSNIEGELIDVIQQSDSKYDGIIINAAGYSHTSVSIRDAISAISLNVVEVHISNIYSREDFRKHSLITEVCKGSVSGFGLESYSLALNYFIENQSI